jgi:hypothetical protein
LTAFNQPPIRIPSARVAPSIGRYLTLVFIYSSNTGNMINNHTSKKLNSCIIAISFVIYYSFIPDWCINYYTLYMVTM